jgi:predicted nucleic acid-binding protein
VCDSGALGAWVTTVVADRRVAAPSVLVYEVANTLRRLELSGQLTKVESSLAFDDLLRLSITSWPIDALAERAWQLRPSVTFYDATYIALAELLDAPLVTLDRRLSRASGPRCSIVTPS